MPKRSYNATRASKMETVHRPVALRAPCAPSVSPGGAPGGTPGGPLAAPATPQTQTQHTSKGGKIIAKLAIYSWPISVQTHTPREHAPPVSTCDA